MSTDPRATYRLQLQPGFDFDSAAAIVGYLADLGVSHLYSSPIFQAAPGSTHGYDVVDPGRVNLELGGELARRRLQSTMSDAGLKLLLDIVPNHMAIGSRDNLWWWDVLENGLSSHYAAYFDVDWAPPETWSRNKVLLPILGDRYGRILEAGEIQIHRDGGTFTVRYGANELPVAPRSLDALLARAARESGSDELAYIAGAYSRLPNATHMDEESIRIRHRDKEVLRLMLARLCREQQAIAAAVDNAVAVTNADHADLDSVLANQNYRLAYWRVAEQDLGYRRFFDISSLAGLRVEDKRVFADTHALVLQWLLDGTVDGVRVDHIDGLRNPEVYLRRLREAAPDSWVVVEKILERDEDLPATWETAGTTGYDFLNIAGGLFVDSAGEGPLTEIYTAFTGQPTSYEPTVRKKKLQVMRETLGGDLNRLTALLLEISEHHPRSRDFTRHELHEALREVIACFPVYRTYVQAEAGIVREHDRGYVEQTIDLAKEHRPDIDPDVFDFLHDILLLRQKGEREGELVMRFQQITGPVMAKGAEDTAFYTFNRLIALNEVGGDPGRFGVSVDAFHRFCEEAAKHRPLGLLATSTHDTKRGEDVRTRIALLSEIPEHWGEAVQRWSTINEQHRRGNAPDRNAEYLLYQTLVGAWPIGVDRVAAFMEKAAREAKEFTSWIDPDPAYEEALRSFVDESLSDPEFLEEFEAFVQPLVELGRVSSLSQTVLKLTAPGVPDIYQGTELWDSSLVDPDNRRPVDYDLRRHLLHELATATPESIMDRSDEGLPKLHVIRQALDLRRRRPVAFGPGADYRPIAAAGDKAGHVVAYLRGDSCAVVAPRLVLGLAGDWENTTIELPPGRWRNVLTGDSVEGGPIQLTELHARFPVALLEREDETG